MKIPPFNRHEVTWATSDLYSSGCKEASLPEKRRSVGLCYVRSYIGGAGNSMLSACPSVCAYVRAQAGVISDRFAGVFWFLVVFKTFDFFFAYNYSYTVFKCMSVIYVHVCMVDKLNPGENLALGSPSKMLSYMNTSNEQWLRVGLYTVCSSSVASSLDKCPVSLRRLGAVNSRVYTRLLSGQSLSPYRSVVLLVS